MNCDGYRGTSEGPNRCLGCTTCGWTPRQIQAVYAAILARRAQEAAALEADHHHPEEDPDAPTEPDVDAD